MQNLNIKVKDIYKREIKLIYDFYKNNLNDILNSNIDNSVINIININAYLLRKIILITQLEIFINILLLLELFNKTANSKNKNFKLFIKTLDYL